MTQAVEKTLISKKQNLLNFYDEIIDIVTTNDKPPYNTTSIPLDRLRNLLSHVPYSEHAESQKEVYNHLKRYAKNGRVELDDVSRVFDHHLGIRPIKEGEQGLWQNLVGIIQAAQNPGLSAAR